jgi:serpin B
MLHASAIRTSSAAVFAACLSVLFSGCQSGDPVASGSDPKSRELLASLSVADREIIRNDNGFGFRLFARLSEKGEGNLFVSPLSVSMLLTMVYNGAGGSTEQEMAEVLGFGGMDRTAVNALYARLIPALTGVDPKVSLKLANSIWSAPRLEPEKAFLDLNRSTFSAEVSTLDFTAPQAADVINKWTSDKTGGLIPEIVQPPLDPSVVMVLINALYFKGDWSKGFDPKATFDADFHLANGTTTPCRLMHHDGFYPFFSEAGVTGLQLDYGDSLFSMVFLQPEATSGMAGLIDSLRDGAWERWDAKFASRDGAILVPKFKLEYGKSLVEDLKALGMPSAFSEAADFTGIRKSGGLTLSEVMHKTYVSVDEKGTEAAAVTSGIVGDTAEPLTMMRLDRPFVVLIREKSSGTVLFVGRVMDPAP